MTEITHIELKSEQRYIFIVGNSRSGTTMMGRIFGSHPDVFMLNELHFFEELWSPADRGKTCGSEQALQLLMKLLVNQNDPFYHRGDPARYTTEAENIMVALPEKAHTKIELFQAFLMFETLRHDKKIPCLQTPRNVYYLKEVFEFFSNSRVIHMVRDPRDILLSQKRRWKQRSLGAAHITRWETFRVWVNYHPVTISHLWNAAIGAGYAFDENPNLLHVKFEDFVRNAVTKLTELCPFVGVDYAPGMEEVPQLNSSSSREAPTAKKINPNVAERWKKGGLTKNELAIAQRINRKYMDIFTYEPANIKPSALVMIFSYVIFPFKLALAFLLNLNRMGSILDTLRRRLAHA
ncbi:sulfotransferase [bacterium]|nr:sulfotransferase [bacterium]